MRTIDDSFPPAGEPAVSSPLSTTGSLDGRTILVATNGRLPLAERAERAAATALLAALVGVVAILWPLAEATRYALEKLFCRER